MTLNEKKELMKEILKGADLSHAQINVFVEAGAKVVYQEVKTDKPVKDVKITDEKAVITADLFGEDGLMLQKGKKGFRRLILK